jgi:hypothetical protein
MFVENMPDQMYFETDVLMDLIPKSVPVILHEASLWTTDAPEEALD